MAEAHPGGESSRREVTSDTDTALSGLIAMLISVASSAVISGTEFKGKLIVPATPVLVIVNLIGRRLHAARLA